MHAASLTIFPLIRIVPILPSLTPLADAVVAAKRDATELRATIV
jgi:uncharacterized membrane protein (GlpM family)